MFLKHEHARYKVENGIGSQFSRSVKYGYFYHNPIWFESHKNQFLFKGHEHTHCNYPALDKVRQFMAQLLLTLLRSVAACQ